jgi:transcriptional regulator with XRE-family HTH domain
MKEPLFRGFGERLAMSIANCGIKKKELARRASMAPRELSAYLRDIRIPRRNRLNKMAEVLGVSPDWLLLGNLSNVGAGAAKEPQQGYDALGSYKMMLLAKVEELTAEEERQALMRCAEALRAGDSKIRQNVIYQMEAIEDAMAHRKKKARKRTA